MPNECPKFKTKILKFELWHLTFWEKMGLGSKEVRSIVISGYGTNCEMEMAHACRLAGSEVVDIVHIIEPTIPVGPGEELPEEGIGVAFFRNAVQYIQNNLL
jgi:hypothetical protein